MMRDEHPLDFSINRFLSDYKNTEHCTTNKTPVYLMFQRQLRTRFDLLKPDVTSTVEAHQYDQKRFKHGNRKCDFTIGEIIYVKDYRRDTNNRTETVIVRAVIICYVHY